MKILLVSHGDFAQGLCSTMREFFGADNVYAASVTAENGTADLTASVERYFQEWGDEQVVICSDLKSGSANQTVTPMIVRPNTYLISGMNLSLVMQLQMEDEVTADTLHEIMELSKQDVVLMNELNLGAAGEDDE